MKDIRVIVIGPSPQMRGGVASVLRAYQKSGFFSRSHALLIPSVTAAAPRQKILGMFKSFCLVTFTVVKAPRAIVHIHCASGTSLWRKCSYILVAWLLGRKVLLQLHSGKLGPYLASLSPPLRKAAVRILRLSSAYLVVSREIEYVLNSYGILGPFFLAKNPVPIDIASTQGICLRSNLPGLLTSRRYVLFVGRLEPEKGIFDLLEAWSHSKDTTGQMILALAGDGDRSLVTSFAEELGIHDNIVFLGWVENIVPLMQHATVFVLPSKFEGQPVSVLEALSCGTPVVATAIGGIPDMIEDEKSGLLIPEGDPRRLGAALVRMLNNTDERQRISDGGKRRFETEFSQNIIESSVLDAYVWLEQIETGQPARRAAI